MNSFSTPKKKGRKEKGFDQEGGGVVGRWCCEASDTCSLAVLQPPLSYVYQSLFKHKISIVDEDGGVWLVQYEGFVSAAQRHYRFTAGWTNLVKQRGIRVGKRFRQCSHQLVIACIASVCSLSRLFHLNCMSQMCCVMPCCVALCCAVLCCAVLCCAVLCCAVLCCAVLQYSTCIGMYTSTCIESVLDCTCRAEA